MASRGKKSGVRKEPQFGLGASLSELRLGPQDRISSGQGKPKRPAPVETEDERFTTSLARSTVGPGRPDDAVRIVVVRDGERRTLTVKLGEQPDKVSTP